MQAGSGRRRVGVAQPGGQLIMHKQILAAACFAAVSLIGCSEREGTPNEAATSPAPAATHEPAPPPIDACSLLTSEEIQAIQGEAPTETKPSTGSEDKMFFSQCFFALPTWINSVSLRLIQKSASPGSPDPKDVWKRTLESVQAKAAASDKINPPRMVSDVGDEAYWAGNAKMGVLYVLQGNRYFHLSVGGAVDEETKIKRCSDLAEAVLKKL